MTSSRKLPFIIASIVALVSLGYVIAEREKADENGISEPDPVQPGLRQADDPPVNPIPLPPPRVPTEDLHAALSEACGDNAAKSVDKEWTPEEIQAQAESLHEQKSKVSKRLSISSNAEHLHLAALLEADPTLRSELLDRAISRSPTDPFLLWSAVQLCSEPAGSSPCPQRDWEQLLIQVDNQNSESWIRIAANRYAANDHAAALEALRHASTAAESRAYWVEMIRMIERGLAAGSDYAFPERAGMAVSFAAALLPSYADYTSMCEEQSVQSVDWAYACLAYGELVESQGKTELGVSIARSIQLIALKGLDEMDKAAEVQQRINARRQERLDSMKDHDPVFDRLIFSNPTLFSSYLAAIKSGGEEAARRLIEIEMERLLVAQPELACETT